ncbi:hypothetical protein MSIBF_A2380006 [groundwater metagenome]|uniref:Uncharacterized protein n=1 Tax=groundwater metagenome TaxID=717931 RepID=A0A098EBV0_9ZZZZ
MILNFITEIQKAIKAAPQIPTINACEDEDGIPKNYVTIFLIVTEINSMLIIKAKNSTGCKGITKNEPLLL